MQHNPLVSVVVPCYNHEKYVEQCIKSVVDQSYRNIELIVADDGSTDNSPAILETLQRKHKFKYERHENLGLPRTLNRAIDKFVTGKYISNLASDDFWDVEKISKQVEFMERNPQYGMCCSMAKIVDDRNTVTGLLGKNIKPTDLELSNMLTVNKIPALTALFRKDLFTALGGYDESLYFEDWDLWLRMAENSKIWFMPDVLGYYRMHNTNMSAKSLRMVDDSINLLDKWKKHPNYNKALNTQKLVKAQVLAKSHKKEALLFLKGLFKSNFLDYRYYIILLKILIS